MELRPGTHASDDRATDDWSLGILRELMTLFIEQTPERLRALRESCLNGNTARTVSAARRLQGSAESLGLRRFAGLSGTVARHAARGDTRLAADSVADLEHEFARTSQVLTAALEWN